MGRDLPGGLAWATRFSVRRARGNGFGDGRSTKRRPCHGVVSESAASVVQAGDRATDRVPAAHGGGARRRDRGRERQSAGAARSDRACWKRLGAALEANYKMVRIR